MLALILGSWTLFPHEKVLSDSPVEALGIASIVALFVTVAISTVQAYKHSRCHTTDCRREWRGRRLPLRRHGKYPHGHLKLCHVHHPLVPATGRVTEKHVREETARKAR